MSEQSERAVTRPDPFADLEAWKPWGGSLRSLMDELLAGGPRNLQGTGINLPNVDITETDEAYRVRAELPGVAKDDVTVEFDQGVLCIRGEKKTRRDEKLERGRRLECAYGAFSRTFRLPQDVDADRISAAFQDGILDVTVAKQPESKPKQIAVRS